MTTDGVYLAGLENSVMNSWRRRQRRELYRAEPEAWLWDVLGYRWHAKQQEIVECFLSGRRSATKSANGTGKTRLFGELITWGIMTHDPGELLVIVSGPTDRQIKNGIFSYIDKNMQRARQRGFEVPGYLTDGNQWNHRVSGSTKAKALVIGQTPPRTNIVGTFQGIRAVSDEDTKTWVFIDEAGAVHNDLFDAAEAVTTGAGDNKIQVIGNPDTTGTRFQEIFEDTKYAKDWQRVTISALDLPTFTGEKVYDDPELQHQMLTSGMIDAEWVATAGRQWGEDSARYKSKVLGEFPDTADWCFFSQRCVNLAEQTEIEPSNDPKADRVMGVDLADGGNDDSKMFLNRNGHVRHYATWNEGSQSVTRIHEGAVASDANIVVIDRIGVGAQVYYDVTARGDRYYTVLGAKASEKSPDPTRWHDNRAYWYDMLREGMLNETVDLDYEELGPNGEEIGKELRKQLLGIRYDMDRYGAIQIESKKDARKRGVDSPDDLDAVVFAVGVKARLILDDPLSDYVPGEVILEDPWEDFAEMRVGMPI